MVYHWFILAHNGHDHHPDDGDDGDGSDDGDDGDGDDGGNGDDENNASDGTHDCAFIHCPLHRLKPAAIHLQLETQPSVTLKWRLGGSHRPEAWPASGHNCAK